MIYWFKNKEFVPKSELDAMTQILLEAADALECSYDAVYHPADGTSKQEITAANIRVFLLQASGGTVDG